MRSNLVSLLIFLIPLFARSEGRTVLRSRDLKLHQVSATSWHTLLFGVKAREVDKATADADPYNIDQKTETGVKRDVGSRYIVKAGILPFANRISSLGDNIDAASPSLYIGGVSPPWNPLKEKYVLLGNGRQCRRRGKASVSAMLISKKSSSVLRDEVEGGDHTEKVYVWSDRIIRQCNCRYSTNRYVVQCGKRAGRVRHKPVRKAARVARSAAVSSWGDVVSAADAISELPPPMLSRDPDGQFSSYGGGGSDALSTGMESVTGPVEQISSVGLVDDRGVKSLADLGNLELNSQGQVMSDYGLDESLDAVKVGKVIKDSNGEMIYQVSPYAHDESKISGGSASVSWDLDDIDSETEYGSYGGDQTDEGQMMDDGGEMVDGKIVHILNGPVTPHSAAKLRVRTEEAEDEYLNAVPKIISLHAHDTVQRNPLTNPQPHGAGGDSTDYSEYYDSGYSDYDAYD